VLQKEACDGLHAAKNDLQNLNYTKFDDEKGRSQDLPV
jgi:hypothetical protein